MGYMCHHAVVVTSWSEAALKEAHAKAIELFKSVPIDIHREKGKPCLVSPIVPGIVNGYASFFVAPDGSKEGWDESNKGDKAREALIEFLRSKAYDDGSSNIQYAEVQFGDEELNAYIVNGSDDDYKKVIKTSEDQE